MTVLSQSVWLGTVSLWISLLALPSLLRTLAERTLQVHPSNGKTLKTEWSGVEPRRVAASGKAPVVKLSKCVYGSLRIYVRYFHPHDKRL